MNKNINFIRNTIIIFFITSLILNKLYAQLFERQNNNMQNIEKTYLGYFTIAANRLNLNSINKSLNNTGYREFSPNFFSIGGGGLIGTAGFLIGGEGTAFKAKRKITEIDSGNNYYTLLDAGYGLFNIGYNLYWTEKTRIIPLFGIGGGRIKLKIIDKKSTSSIEDILKNPGRNSNISTGGFLINAAIQIYYTILKSELIEMKIDEDEYNYETGLILGLRVGYIFTPFKNKWKIDEIDLSIDPPLRMLGPYIQCNIGLSYDYYSPK